MLLPKLLSLPFSSLPPLHPNFVRSDPPWSALDDCFLPSQHSDAHLRSVHLFSQPHTPIGALFWGSSPLDQSPPPKTFAARTTRDTTSSAPLLSALTVIPHREPTSYALELFPLLCTLTGLVFFLVHSYPATPQWLQAGQSAPSQNKSTFVLAIDCHSSRKHFCFLSWQPITRRQRCCRCSISSSITSRRLRLRLLVISRALTMPPPKWPTSTRQSGYRLVRVDINEIAGSLLHRVL